MVFELVINPTLNFKMQAVLNHSFKKQDDETWSQMAQMQI